jgi:hypothetical protein
LSSDFTFTIFSRQREWWQQAASSGIPQQVLVGNGGGRQEPPALALPVHGHVTHYNHSLDKVMSLGLAERTDLIPSLEIKPVAAVLSAASVSSSLSSSLFSCSISTGCGGSATKAFQFLKKLDTRLLSMRTEREILNLEECVARNIFYLTRASSRKCGLYGLCHALDRNDVVTSDDVTAQALHMEQMEWLPYQLKKLTTFIQVSVRVPTEKDMKTFPKTISLPKTYKSSFDKFD